MGLGQSLVACHLLTSKAMENVTNQLTAVHLSFRISLPVEPGAAHLTLFNVSILNIFLRPAAVPLRNLGGAHAFQNRFTSASIQTGARLFGLSVGLHPPNMAATPYQ